MAKTITPSQKPITEGEIGKINELVSAQLRKSKLDSGLVQEVIRTNGVELATNLVADLRCRTEAISNLIVRHVKVDRSRAPQEVLKVTGRKQYIDDDVVANMPRGEGDEEVDVVFFKLDRWVSDDELAEEYKLRDLDPCDPFSLSAINEDDPAFADEHPNGTHWKDSGGEWCYTAFSRWDDERLVVVYRLDHEWFGYWWFAGFRRK